MPSSLSFPCPRAEPSGDRLGQGPAGRRKNVDNLQPLQTGGTHQATGRKTHSGLELGSEGDSFSGLPFTSPAFLWAQTSPSISKCHLTVFLISTSLVPWSSNLAAPWNLLERLRYPDARLCPWGPGMWVFPSHLGDSNA